MSDYRDPPAEPWSTDDPASIHEFGDELLEVRTRPRGRARRVLGLLAAMFVFVAIGSLIYVERQFSGIERVDVAHLLAPDVGAGTNYLIVGSDSRENLDRDVENAGAIFGDGTEDIAGQRTDTIQILRISDDGSQHILALPRDLYLPLGGNGNRDRINAAYAFGGPELLISTVQGSLGIPIHHYVEIDFAGFIDLVDAVGGVTIDFPYPAFDEKTGLNIISAGPAELDSAQALAFVRSRNYTEVIDGRNVVDRRGDLGRVKRQQEFLKALFSELKNPLRQVLAIGQLDASAGSVKLDNRISFRQAVGLARRLRGFEPNSDWDLVVSDARAANGAQVLQLNVGASQPTLDFFSS